MASPCPCCNLGGWLSVCCCPEHSYPPTLIATILAIDTTACCNFTELSFPITYQTGPIVVPPAFPVNPPNFFRDCHGSPAFLPAYPGLDPDVGWNYAWVGEGETEEDCVIGGADCSGLDPPNDQGKCKFFVTFAPGACCYGVNVTDSRKCCANLNNPPIFDGPTYAFLGPLSSLVGNIPNGGIYISGSGTPGCPGSVGAVGEQCAPNGSTVLTFSFDCLASLPQAATGQSWIAPWGPSGFTPQMVTGVPCGYATQGWIPSLGGTQVGASMLTNAPYRCYYRVIISLPPEPGGAPGRVIAGFDQGFSIPAPTSVPRKDWPGWASKIGAYRKAGDKGVGDTIARKMGSVGRSFKKWFKRLTGLDCGCEKRQAEFNLLYPYQDQSPSQLTTNHSQ